MAQRESSLTPHDTWDGPFSGDTYAVARVILEEDRIRVHEDVASETKRRGRIVLIPVIIWSLCSAALAFVDSNLLVVAEIGWIAVVAWAVFWLFPAIVGRANVDDMYDQYQAQLEMLEESKTPMPEPSCIEDLVAAIDLVSPVTKQEASANQD